MDYSPIEKARSILAKHYAPNGAVEEAGLDILLDILFNLLQGCFARGSSARDVLRLGRSSNRREQRGIHAQVFGVVRDYLVRTFGFGAYIRYNGRQIVDTMLAAVKDSDVEETDLLEFMALRLPN